jgi:hypothetical protein
MIGHSALENNPIVIDAAVIPTPPQRDIALVYASLR